MSRSSVAKTKGPCVKTTFCVMIELVKARSFYVAIEYFFVATEFGLGQGFRVATKYFMSRQSMAK